MEQDSSKMPKQLIERLANFMSFTDAVKTSRGYNALSFYAMHCLNGSSQSQLLIPKCIGCCPLMSGLRPSSDQ